MINKEELYKLVFYFVAAVTASLIRLIRIKILQEVIKKIKKMTDKLKGFLERLITK